MKKRALQTLLALICLPLLSGILAAQGGTDKPIPPADQPTTGVSAVPEPGLLVAVGGGILALALVKRKRR